MFQRLDMGELTKKSGKIKDSKKYINNTPYESG
jgi:hypothetical protein